MDIPQTTGRIRYNPSTEEMQHLFTTADEVIRYERKNKNVIFEDQQHVMGFSPGRNLSYYDRENKELKTHAGRDSNNGNLFSVRSSAFTLDNPGQLLADQYTWHLQIVLLSTYL